MQSCLYRTRIVHQRFHPKAHFLSYDLTYFMVDLDELAAIDQENTLFGFNRWRLYSFLEKDFGDRSGTALRPQVIAHLKDAGIDQAIGQITLLALPRLFGFAFNPLSVYYCYDIEDRLIAVLYEVTNTFKERHTYVVPCKTSAIEEADETKLAPFIAQECRKQMYVSPFAALDLNYEFLVQMPTDRLNLVIHQKQSDRTVLTAAMAGRRIPLTPRTLLTTCLQFPLQTFKVVAGIHWEALKLWLKGLKVFDHREPVGPSRSIGRTR